MIYTYRWVLSLLLLVVAFWLSLVSFAAVPIPFQAAFDALLPGKVHSIAEALVFNLRLPRALVAMLLGASLALAGALLQVLTHNPLASPAVLGINSGAALAIALTSAFSPMALQGYPLSVIAAAGGGLSWLCVSAAGRGSHQQQDRQRLILAGIALSAFCMALTRVTLLLAEDHAFGILYWLAGGISHARWQQVWQLLPFVGLLAPLVLLQARSLNLLGIGDDAAHALGVNLRRLRIGLSFALLLLVGACVSVAGPLGFIGLLVPHVARAWIGHDLRIMLPMSMLLGAMFLLVADIAARGLAWPGEIPAGVVLGLVGAPCFVWLARRQRS
ncbi:iron-dicitrate transporter permease subunit [Pantoea rodasii]|uniref:Iron-dicitrate transporter permease subunit n=1 Tax=Pantoea rodasii TaxID=1076549 RepID=A0A2M9W5Y3_9GAMM|nr:iron-dicitrate ABC transporter permease FecC [Pantoea rodasii]ORM65329.1 iron-dicitrate transporter permease subunit [Pantoea rodasii]PJZ02960.1 iron-dicitrate transporter permease subunit [Pantoea rodasii]